MNSKLWQDFLRQADGHFQIDDGGLSVWLPAQIPGPEICDPISDAHRAVLERHHPRVETLSGYEQYLPDVHVCNECSWERAIGPEEAVYWPCPTWRDISLAYQHNDGFREEWR